LVVQLQQQRLVSHKQLFSSWADGVARHTGVTSAHPKKHQPCVIPLQQQAVTQPQAQAQELTAGYIAGGSTNEIHALSRMETRVAAHKYIHTLYCISLYITTLAGCILDFSSHQKGFFSWNLNGHWVPNVSISLVGPQSIAIHFVVTILILSAYTHCGLLGWVYLGRHPWGYPKRPILGASV